MVLIGKEDYMSIFVIGDLHLSLNTDKPMDIFGDSWHNHHEKIKADWLSKVTEEDCVILPGDLSWAMSFKEAETDLGWIDELPGQKVAIKGNHDYWWTSKTKMDNQYKSIHFIHNSFESFGDIAICGTRGWLCPNEVQFDEQDEKIYKREAARLETSILKAKEAGYDQIIGVLHYPPTNEEKAPSLFTACFENYGIKTVVYGHIHGGDFDRAIQGLHGGVNYHLTSCDFLEFKLLTLVEDQRL